MEHQSGREPNSSGQTDRPVGTVDEDANPDFTIIDAVVADIARGLQPGTVVSIETTIPVGTTRTRM